MIGFGNHRMPVDPVVQALAAPAQPFVWGAGGAKLTPDQIAELRARGMAKSQSDYSPVGHWLQGVGRVVDNATGALDVKRAERMNEQNNARDMEFAEALAGGGVDDATIARVLMDPNAGAGVREFAGMEYAARRPKASAPTELEKLMIAANIQRGSPQWNSQIEAELTNRRDPFVNFSGPGFGYSGRQSGLVQAMGGGDQASGAPQTTAPPAEAIAALKRGEGTAEQFDEMFGAGAAARVMGGQASAPDPFPVR